jgi:two-component system sensor histidine kinase PilS (NtrC family)
VNLGSQLEHARVSLESERTAAADLLTLHEDIVRSLSSGLVTVDRRDRVISANHAATEILGLPQSRLDGVVLGELFPGLERQLGEIGPLGRLSRGELRLAREGSAAVIGISVSPLFNHQNQALGRVIHFQDLTEMRRMEESVKRGERLAAIGRLAAGVAHEIRNPLASISGSIELLGQIPQADEEGRALMQIITREIDRLDGLINELLEFASPRPLRPANIDLTAVVHDTLSVFHRDPSFANVEVKLSPQPAARSLLVRADPEKMRQVLWNLLRNAAEAAREGGGRVTVGLERKSASVLLSVGDDGPGIEPDLLERIFDPFFTTKTRGTGLGLATVQTIVNDHGGGIRVESQPGRGSSFTVELPYTAADAE